MLKYQVGTEFLAKRSDFSARMHRQADFTTGEMLRIGKVLGLQPEDYYRVFFAESAAQLEGKHV